MGAFPFDLDWSLKQAPSVSLVVFIMLVLITSWVLPTSKAVPTAGELTTVCRQTFWKSVLQRLILMTFPCTFLLFLFFPQNVSAHPVLLRSDPAENSVLSDSPGQIRMWFSENVNPALSTASVTNVTSAAANVQNDVKTHVDKGDAHTLANDSKEIDVSLKLDLPSAVYIVFYRTQAAEDGHILSGSFLFTIAGANGSVPTFKGTLPQQAPFGGSGNANGQFDGPALFSLIMVTLVNMGAAFWVGGELWLAFINPNPESENQEQQKISEEVEERFSNGFAVPILLVMLLANLGVLVGMALSVTGGQWEQALVPSLLISLVAQSHFGLFWIMREIVILLALLLSLSTMLVKQPSEEISSMISWGNFVLVLALLVALAESGHAAATKGNLLGYAVLADYLHLLAAAVWVGGMLFIAVIYLPVLRRKTWQQQTASLLTLLPRYSPFATTGVTLMGLSGPFNATMRLLSWDQLVTTAYGRTLLVKVLLVGAMMLVSAVHVLLLRPRLAKDFKTYQAAAMETAQPSEEEKPANHAPIDEVQMKELEKRIMWQTQRLSMTLRWEPLLGVAVLLCTGLLSTFAGTL